MTLKISEKRLLFAILLFTPGIYLVVSNSVNFSSPLISEKTLLSEVIGICLILAGALALNRMFKKA